MRLPLVGYLVATLARKSVCCTDFIQCVQVRIEYVLRCSRLEHLAPVHFFLLCQEDPSLEDVGRSQMLSLNRIELLQSLRRRSSQKTHPDKLHIPVSEPQLCLLQSLPDASNFETCHALEPTTVMKTHLGCCSIK